MVDPHLNSVHLELPRRDAFRKARQVMLDSRGANTIRLDGENLFRGTERGETISDPPAQRTAEKVTLSTLLLVEGDRHHVVKIGVNTIGRLPDNDIVIVDPHASRRHCTILVHTNNKCEVHDLASKNGTFVNGHKIIGSNPICPGDELRLGDLRLLFLRKTEAVETGPEPQHKTSIILKGGKPVSDDNEPSSP